MGKLPDDSDLLNSIDKNGDTNPRTSLSNQVRTGSSSHVFDDDEVIIFSTSSAVTTDHTSNV